MTIVDESPAPTGTLIDLGPNPAVSQQRHRVTEAVAALADGRAIVLCDDYERPARGEVIYAAACAGTAITAFAIRHTSGFLHVALTSERCDQLGLVSQSSADPTSNACVTVDAKIGVGTGISAADRATTARLLAARYASAESFTRPGHVVPMRARMHLPTHQYGLAEAAVWLVASAGLPAAAVTGTIIGITDPTDIAAGVDLIEFAHRNGLPLIGVGDITATHTDEYHPAFTLKLPTADGRITNISHTDDGSHGFVQVVLGAVAGRSAVPLHIIPAQRLENVLARDDNTPAIVICTPQDRPEVLTRLHHEARQAGSLLHGVLRRTGARSVWTSNARADS